MVSGGWVGVSGGPGDLRGPGDARWRVGAGHAREHGV